MWFFSKKKPALPKRLVGESDEAYLERRAKLREAAGTVLNLAASRGCRNKDEVRQEYSDMISKSGL